MHPKRRARERVVFSVVLGCMFQAAPFQDLPLAATGLSGQEVTWPRAGTRLRITSRSGPPSTIVRAVRELGLEGAPRSVLRVGADGSPRFAGLLVDGSGGSFRIQRSDGGPSVAMELTDLVSLERALGRVSHARGGFILGAVIGAAVGVGFASAIGENPGAGGYLEGAAVVGLPFGVVGALLGHVLSSDAWAVLYASGS